MQDCLSMSNFGKVKLGNREMSAFVQTVILIFI